LHLLRKLKPIKDKNRWYNATVGDFIILDSDIDKSYLELSSQGNSMKDTRCQMLKLLEDKLYAHQAIQDSVKVTDAEVKGMMEND
jgi:peptidyl-prolyl cis-trans isomerase SurA